MACRKCGTDQEPKVEWHDEERVARNLRIDIACRDAGEHLHKRCGRCGYEWTEPPADAAQESEGQEVALTEGEAQ